jgi:hypothetical protein
VNGGAPYEVFVAQLTQPTGGNPDWVLTIETNYPTSISPGNVIPTVAWPANNLQYSIGDFLITWNGVDYGVVLSPHVQAGVAVDTGFQSGNLYQAPGFQLSSTVLPVSPDPNQPVWLASVGTLLGAGTVTVAQTGDGNTTGMYTITDEFSAPPDFLSTGTFTIEFSPQVCANGLVTGTGSFAPQLTLPEPGTFSLMIPALLLVGYRVCRRKREVLQTRNRLMWIADESGFSKTGSR